MSYLLYATIAGLSTIIGGLLLFYTKIKKIDMRYLVAFSAGVIISTALFEMIPEVKNFFAVGIGFFFLYFVEKIMMIHACQERECEYTYHEVGWLSALGLSVDNFVDGVAIAAGYLINPVLGLTIAFAVVVHELPQGISTAVIMREKYKKLSVLLVLIVAAVLTPLGAIFSSTLSQQTLDFVLGFAAGTFIFIGASDLLPEAHQKFNFKVILSVMVGAIIMPLLGVLI